MHKLLQVFGALILLSVGLHAADVENPFRMPATTCTNQFIRSIATITGVGTCATVGSSDLASSLVLTTPNIGVATGTSISFGGSALNTYVSNGAWTPIDSSGAALTFTAVSAGYTQIGNMVFAYSNFTYPTTADGTMNVIGGLPVTVPNQEYARKCDLIFNTAATPAVIAVPVKNTTTFSLFSSGAATRLTNAQLSLSTVSVMCTYPAT